MIILIWSVKSYFFGWKNVFIYSKIKETTRLAIFREIVEFVFISGHDLDFRKLSLFDSLPVK